MARDKGPRLVVSDGGGGWQRRYTDKQKQAFRQRFVDIQRMQVAALVMPAGAVVLVAASIRYLPDLWEASGTIVFGTLGLVLAAALFTWRNWRCPACSKLLGRRLNPGHCPKCGVPLAARS